MAADELKDILADARWLAHRFDFEADAYHFVRMSKDKHRATSFLNDHHIDAALERRVLPRPAAIAAPKPRAPIHFIFHSGLTCSTLLARALDHDGAAMTLKEPTILNDVVRYGLQRRSADDTRRALGEVLDLLGRPFRPDEPVIVKTASVANGLAEAIVGNRPETQALCLYAPLPVFLAATAQKGLFGRLWSRKLFIGLHNAGMADFGFSDRDLLAHTDLQAAAIAWLAQHRMFGRLVSRFGADRVRVVDSEALTDRPQAAIEATAAHFRLPLAAEEVRSIVEGPVFKRHAKSGEAFDPRQRKLTLRQARATHADEIDKVVVWGGQVAEAAGIPLDLGAKLLV